MNRNLIRFQPNLPFIITNFSRYLSFSQQKLWQKYENERYFNYEPMAEEPWKRIKHGITYDLRRAARRYKEVYFILEKKKFFKFFWGGGLWRIWTFNYRQFVIFIL
jgi:hypothetical protein